MTDDTASAPGLRLGRPTPTPTSPETAELDRVPGRLPEGAWLPDQGVAPYRGRG